jgi:hypothetical protein
MDVKKKEQKAIRKGNNILPGRFVTPVFESKRCTGLPS